MREPVTFEDGMGDGGKCPVPGWVLRPLALALPALGIVAVLWFLFLR